MEQICENKIKGDCVRAALTQLDSGIRELKEKLDILQKELDPILIPAKPETPKKDAEKYESQSTSQIASVSYACYRSIRNLACDVENLLGRLNI
jgi:hypothetical protein